MFNFFRGPKLEELEYGFYSVRGPPILNGEKLIVAVHPYYQSKLYHTSFDSYYVGLTSLLQNYSGPIITLEESRRVKDTFKHYLDIGANSNRFFIKTLSSDPDTKEMEFNEMCDIFNRLRNNKPIHLIGGYFWRKELIVGGCLGHLVVELESNSLPVTIDKHLIF